MVISLGCRLLDTSSGLPEGSAGRVNAFYLTLLRAGFTLPSLLPVTRCALTAPLHPCPSRQGGTSAVCSLWHCPSFRRIGTPPTLSGRPCPVESGLSSPMDWGDHPTDSPTKLSVAYEGESVK